MKLVKKMRYRDNLPYKIKCNFCGSIFEFQYDDMRCSREFGLYLINCPCCETVLPLADSCEVYQLRGRTWKI